MGIITKTTSNTSKWKYGFSAIFTSQITPEPTIYVLKWPLRNDLGLYVTKKYYIFLQHLVTSPLVQERLEKMYGVVIAITVDLTNLLYRKTMKIFFHHFMHVIIIISE